MGTNYYRIKPITKKEFQELHIKLNDLLNRKIQDYEFIEELNKVREEHEVHICKCSLGWQTCFDHNWGKYYQPNKRSLENFLLEEGTWIENEYGNKINYVEFWDIINEHNKNPNNKWTSKSYKEETGDVNNYLKECIVECKKVLGIDSKGEGDFIIDGLRFAVCSDFS